MDTPKNPDLFNLEEILSETQEGQPYSGHTETDTSSGVPIELIHLSRPVTNPSPHPHPSAGQSRLEPHSIPGERQTSPSTNESRFPGPLHPNEDQYPWTPDEDEAFRRGAFRRSWQHQTRRENHAVMAGYPMCSCCGYRWHRLDFYEFSDICWYCHMMDNKREEYEKILASVASLSGKRHGETAPPPILKKLGDKKEK